MHWAYRTILGRFIMNKTHKLIHKQTDTLIIMIKKNTIDVSNLQLQIPILAHNNDKNFQF